MEGIIIQVIGSIFPIAVETIDKIIEHYNIYDYINNVSRYEVID